MTDAERKLWWHLKRIPIENTHFRKQATIGPYFADFASHRQRIVIELDGGQHNQPGRAAADEKRSEYLRSQGYRVLRFWNNDVLSNIEGVMESIFATLQDAESRPPPLTPPHRSQELAGGGERRDRRLGKQPMDRASLHNKDNSP
jgi:very-short-patch-repair endonuclease